MKLKYIVAALGLVASAASQAALVNPDALGNGELALVVYDANASYTLDLGVTFNQFLAGANTTNANLATLTSANWSAFTTAEGANSADWQYAVIGGKDNNGGNNAAILSTIDASFVGQVGANYDSSAVQGGEGQIALSFYNNVNTTGTHKTLANGDSYNVSGTPAYYLNSSMDSFNGVLYQNNGAVGTDLAVDLVARQQSGSAPAVETTLAGVMNLSQVGGNYVLSYNVAAVPEAPALPMAAAGLAMLSFLALRRRNSG